MHPVRDVGREAAPDGSAAREGAGTRREGAARAAEGA